MEEASIYDHPTVYDRIMQPGPCEAFYSSLALLAGGAVLELACGTGRLTIPLARAGHVVVGLDSSPAMLGRAREKAAAAVVDVAFMEGDMRSFEIGRPFALIIVPCNSLAHLTEDGDARACLTQIARHLAPGGLLAFDVVNPDLRALGRPDQACVRLDVGPNPCSGIAVEEFGSYDPIQQIRILRWRLREPDIRVRELAALTLRQFFPQEVPLLLEAAGLELSARYGDFAQNPLSAESLNQVCVARLTPCGAQAAREA